VRLFFLLGGITAIGPLAIDMYLPALPQMAAEFGVEQAQAGLTLTAFLVGLATGQILAGPLSDALGRRRPLLVGVALYALASLLCALAPSIYILVAMRLLQGLCAAIGTVIARAIVRDVYAGHTAARFFSMLMLVTGVSPLLAPFVGSQLLLVTSWHGVFAVLFALGLLLWVSVALGLGESLPVERRRTGGLRDAITTFGKLLGDRIFLGYVLTYAVAFTGVFAFIAGSSFVLQGVYGVSPQTYGLLFGLVGFGLIVAS
jgi:DHA1 family bicyclomycin/chloramphenicol resistance-like MFS transporter